MTKGRLTGPHHSVWVMELLKSHLSTQTKTAKGKNNPVKSPWADLVLHHCQGGVGGWVGGGGGTTGIAKDAPPEHSYNICMTWKPRLLYNCNKITIWNIECYWPAVLVSIRT